jgi:hypothetical protein
MEILHHGCDKYGHTNLKFVDRFKINFGLREILNSGIHKKSHPATLNRIDLKLLRVQEKISSQF